MTATSPVDEYGERNTCGTTSAEGCRRAGAISNSHLAYPDLHGHRAGNRPLNPIACLALPGDANRAVSIRREGKPRFPDAGIEYSQYRVDVRSLPTSSCHVGDIDPAKACRAGDGAYASVKVLVGERHGRHECRPCWWTRWRTTSTGFRHGTLPFVGIPKRGPDGPRNTILGISPRWSR